eukprot:scaffold149846_cov25-Prasinocladus_malaysianus.AAC.1
MDLAFKRGSMMASGPEGQVERDSGGLRRRQHRDQRGIQPQRAQLAGRALPRGRRRRQGLLPQQTRPGAPAVLCQSRRGRAPCAGSQHLLTPSDPACISSDAVNRVERKMMSTNDTALPTLLRPFQVPSCCHPTKHGAPGVQGQLLGPKQNAVVVLNDFPAVLLSPMLRSLPALENAVPAASASQGSLRHHEMHCVGPRTNVNYYRRRVVQKLA